MKLADRISDTEPVQSGGGIADAIIGAVDAFNGWVRRHVLLSLLLVLVLALAFPDVGLWLSRWTFLTLPLGWTLDFATVVLALPVLAASVLCDLDEFTAVLARRRAVGVALVCIYLVVPFIAVTMGALASLSLGPEIGSQVQIGFLLSAVVPITATASAWVRMNGGRAPLFLAALLVTMSLSIVTIPLYLSVLPSIARGEVEAPIDNILRMLVIGVTLPMALGVFLRRRFAAWTRRWEPAFAVGSTVGLWSAVLTNVAVVMPSMAVEVGVVLQIIAFTVLCNALWFGTGLLAARLSKATYEDATVMLFAVGMRSNAQAMVVAMRNFPTLPFATVPAGIFLICQHFIAAYLTRIMQVSRNPLFSRTVGSSRAALERWLEGVMPRNQRRFPGTALLALEVVSPRSGGLDLAVKLARRTLRVDDYVAMLEPNRLAIVLSNTNELGAAVVARKLAAAGEVRQPTVRFNTSIVHSSAHDDAGSMIEAAFKLFLSEEKTAPHPQPRQRRVTQRWQR